MKVLIIGYGKMGKEIEQILVSKKHDILGKITHSNSFELEKYLAEKPDVAIEFTNPENAFSNIKKCMKFQIPCISGSTGWLDNFEEVKKLCDQNNTAFFYASNYSLGVNLFFHFNKKMAEVMNKYPEYEVSIEETHHTHKKDAPSGTAISTAEGIIKHNSKLDSWSLNKGESNKINIIANRKDEVPGTHIVKYQSEIDSIELKHEAKSRKGFAIGAVLASEWIINKKGVFGMKDLLKLD